jgi:hypothetical protein
MPAAAAFVFLATSCGQPTSAARQPTPSVVPNLTPAAAVPGSPPPGGPVPAQLLGNWFMPPVADDAINGNGSCPKPATTSNCFIELNLAATTYHLTVTDAGGKGQYAGSGNVVVNNNEIDFFNGAICGLQLPDGVGRYTWTLKGAILHFTLISDPCSRYEVLAYQGYGQYPKCELEPRTLNAQSFLRPLHVGGPWLTDWSG